MYVDAGPVYTRIVERLRWLPETDDEAPAPGDLPPREQRLLLMRLAALFGPDAIAHAPRATRQSADEHVRVVSGLHALTRAVAEIDRLPEAARTPGVVTSFDEVTLVNPGINPASIERRVRGTRWKMVDRSESGCRLMAPAKEAPAKLGELLAINDGGNWILGVVRRMQRQQVDEMTVGIAAQPDRSGRSLHAGQHDRARHRQRALSDPLHADARAADRLDMDALQRGAQAGAVVSFRDSCARRHPSVRER